MVQFHAQHVDTSFAALSDATRRGVLERLAREDASITQLADTFQMTLTGMKKHVSVLEHAGLVVTEKVGRVRTCRLGVSRLEQEAAWIERYRQLWAARFDELDKVVEELKQKENANGRKKLKRCRRERHQGRPEVRARACRHESLRRSGPHRVRSLDQARAADALVGAEVLRHHLPVLRGRCPARRHLQVRVRSPAVRTADGLRRPLHRSGAPLTAGRGRTRKATTASSPP